MNFYAFRKRLLKFWFFRSVVKKPYMAVKKAILIATSIARLKKVELRMQNSDKRILYLDVPIHPNMGDLAQYYCIKEWMEKYYSEYEIIEIDADVIITATKYFKTLLKKMSKEDLIMFQSGYCTQDLGGYHDEVHRIVVDNVKEAEIIMLPQTIFYKNMENARRTANSYKNNKNLTILARDVKSFEYAKELFPFNRVKLCPDFVTSQIGKMSVLPKEKRNGILLCCRNDSEKYYSDEQISNLKEKLEDIDKVTIFDTTVQCDFSQLKNNIKGYVEEMIKEFSNYRVVITDRYHGTIFSLIAGTPVIVIKTNDHKVVTGVDWFKGIYDSTVCYIDDIEQVPACVKTKIDTASYSQLKPYFEENYFKELRIRLEDEVND